MGRSGSDSTLDTADLVLVYGPSKGVSVAGGGDESGGKVAAIR